jgi:hypothetical protein
MHESTEKTETGTKAIGTDEPGTAAGVETPLVAEASAATSLAMAPRKRGGRARKHIIADGSEVWIDPRADFATQMVETYGNYLTIAQGRPREDIYQDVLHAHPEKTPEQLQEATDEVIDRERSRAGAVHLMTVIGEQGMMYVLAGLAIGKCEQWARDGLYADEAQVIVQIGCEVAGMEAYIKNSLTFPVTTVSPKSAGEIERAQKEALAKIKAKQGLPDAASDSESKESSASSTDSDQENGTPSQPTKPSGD